MFRSVRSRLQWRARSVVTVGDLQSGRFSIIRDGVLYLNLVNVCNRENIAELSILTSGQMNADRCRRDFALLRNVSKRQKLAQRILI